jgi:hypothetical protein
MQRSPVRILGGAALVGVVTAALAASWIVPASASSSFIGGFHRIKTVASTVPHNGDVNPYGTAVVPDSMGRLVQGDVLVSNFNARSNLQGTGTTIVQVAPDGSVSQFARIRRPLPGACPGGVGLTTALGVLSSGWVIVGSLPTTDGSAATAKAGCLIVLDSMGRVRETISGHGINGPWDMATVDLGHAAVLFVSNVLRGTVAGGGGVVNRGTVLRIVLGILPQNPPIVLNRTVVGSGFPERTDPAALVVGPTGLACGPHGDLYVADSVGNRIAVIPNALLRFRSGGKGRTVTRGGALNTPLGLTLAPNGDILTVNGGDGNIVETTPGGMQVATMMLDSSGSPPGAGALFGLAVAPRASGVYFVDDATNELDLLH